MRIALPVLGFAGALLLPGVAGAQPPAGESRLVGTFASVCLEHLDDRRAQSSAAISAPLNFVQDGPATRDGITAYRSATERLAVSGPLRSCALTSEVDAAVSLASVAAVVAAALGADEGRPLEAESRYWLFAAAGGEEFVLGLRVSNARGPNLATLWVQPRSTLSDRN
jgi:hypothetical protein